ncbi:uncharacterized protein LAESUDRAFT_656763 [Laetiporus sulphureus 93-53]|uniref:F-box domain-containing protein n=1 Tax=Laetiporus sulphureus 93-53 TaxID=1314785 RepID=A0A165DKK5_9APHY|nr:uncharacterized protein LAESUDRAFT_656763 [Laetiporus sulphureus 93-53]KZT05087.1 hypothetical protein LAESUDRAFT_656763 [Laetiporus sulphureus 93-53]
MEWAIYDMIIRIFDILRYDTRTLFNCSLVNHAFAEAVSRILYREVTLSPASTNVLDLRRRDDFSQGILHSACIPRNAKHVLCFELSGYPSPRPFPLNPLSKHLEEAFKCWHNLTTVILTPRIYHQDLLTNVLPLLPTLPLLQNLSVNTSCTDDVHAPGLVHISGLKALCIQNPTRAILQLLPNWLGKLTSSLRGLHLVDNCGSITPGVLRSFVPHLFKIEALSLGLSYSLTDFDVFTFLEEMTSLVSLDLRYYLQLRQPPKSPRLDHLRSLTVRYTPVNNAKHATRLCKWTRMVIEHAPLVELRLVCTEEDRGSSVNFDGLLAHLSHKHAKVLRILRMDKAFVGRKALRHLCSCCENLEELAIAISGDLLHHLPELFTSLRNLHTIRIETRNAKRSRVFLDTDQAREFIVSCPDRLRRLAMDGMFWEVRVYACSDGCSDGCAQGQWVSDPQNEVRFVVRQVNAQRAALWEKT